MADGNTNFIVLWVDDTAIVKKPLDGKTFYYVADAVTGKPVAKANVEFFGWQAAAIATSRRSTRCSPSNSPSSPTPTARSCSTRKQQPQDYQWLIIARTPQGPLRLPGLHRRLVRQLVRRRVQRHQGLHDHRPARLPARADGEVQVLGAPRASTTRRTPPTSPTAISPSKSTIPRARRSSRKRRRPTPTAASRASTNFPADATLGVYRADVVKDHRRRQLPRRGVQEARVRGDGRRPRRAGHARREDHGHDQGQVLLRLAGHQGQGEVQGQPHQLQRAAGIPSGRGTGSTGRAIGGSPTTTTGIPAGSTGAACGRCRSGGRGRSSRRRWWPTARSRSAPTAR